MYDWLEKGFNGDLAQQRCGPFRRCSGYNPTANCPNNARREAMGQSLNRPETVGAIHVAHISSGKQ